MSFAQYVILTIIVLCTLKFCIFAIADKVLTYKENKSIKEFTARFEYINEEIVKLREEMNEINDKVKNLDSQTASRFDNYKTVVDMEMADISKRLNKVEVI